VSTKPGADPLKVNDPLRIDGDRLYLIGHGYAPQFIVTFPNGQTRTQTLQFQPENATTFLSGGAMLFDPPGGLYPNDAERRKSQIALQGLFAPTAQFTGTLLTSSFPRMDDPAVAIDIYNGDTGLDTGKPQSIFALDAGKVASSNKTGSTSNPARPPPSPTAARSGSTAPSSSCHCRYRTTPRSSGYWCSRYP